MSEIHSAGTMLGKAWALAKRFDAASIPHEFKVYRFDAVSILAASPGEYWEIDFLADGTMDVEIYKSVGIAENPEATIDELIRRDTEANETSNHQ